MKLQVILRIFKENTPIIVFPQKSFEGFPYPSIVMCYTSLNGYVAGHYETIMRNSVEAREEDVANLLDEIRQKYEVKIIQLDDYIFTETDHGVVEPIKDDDTYNFNEEI